MADALAEKLAEVLFGSTNAGDISSKNFTFRICRVSITSPGNLAQYAPGELVTVKFDTTCCEDAHELKLLDDKGAVVSGCGCTPTNVTCVSGTSGSGSGSCDIRMPGTEGYFTLELLIGTLHQTCITFDVRRRGFLAWLKRLCNI